MLKSNHRSKSWYSLSEGDVILQSNGQSECIDLGRINDLVGGFEIIVGNPDSRFATNSLKVSKAV